MTPLNRFKEILPPKHAVRKHLSFGSWIKKQLKDLFKNAQQ
tara:strand:+ start:592 stop:714 length:123 start_codon:yes stop_codon:yes gene_type:complete